MGIVPFLVDRCSHCHLANRVYLQYLGLPFRCRHCGQKFTVRDREADSLSMDQPINAWNSGKIAEETDAPAVRPR